MSVIVSRALPDVRDGLIVAGRVYQDTLRLRDIWTDMVSKDFFVDPS